MFSHTTMIFRGTQRSKICILFLCDSLQHKSFLSSISTGISQASEQGRVSSFALQNESPKLPALLLLPNSNVLSPFFPSPIFPHARSSFSVRNFARLGILQKNRIFDADFRKIRIKNGVSVRNLTFEDIQKSYGFCKHALRKHPENRRHA